MKKILLVLLAFSLSSKLNSGEWCMSNSGHNISQATSQELCTEYNGTWICC